MADGPKKSRSNNDERDTMVVDPRDIEALRDVLEQSKPTQQFDKQDRPTVGINPQELQPWPLALAALERIGPWTHYAFKLGTLALLQECVRAMALPDAKAELVNEARKLVEALARLHWEL